MKKIGNFFIKGKTRAVYSIKKKFENTNSNIYRKNILDTLKNLNHILVRDHKYVNLKTNIDFESVDFNRYCIISNLIKNEK